MHRLQRRPRKNRKGFLLVEALLGITLLGLTISAVAFIMLHGQEESQRGGERVRATLLSTQALEGLRSIRNQSFTGLVLGVHGVAVGMEGTWVLSGSVISFAGGYTTSVEITSLSSDIIRATATTRWKHGYNRSGSVVLATDYTNWRIERVTGDWSSVSLEGSYTNESSPLFNDVAVSDNYAFVTADATTGIYVFDISNLSSPSRVASAFQLGYSAYDVAVKDDVLYVLTSDASNELKAYVVASPTTFSAGDLIADYDIPGAGRARSMAMQETILSVGADESATGGYDEYYLFDVSNTGSIVLHDSLDDTSSFKGIAAIGATFYLAGTDNVSELRVGDRTTPSNTTFLGGYNLTDVHDGLSVIAHGTGVVLGRADGAAVSELAKFTVASNPVPSSPGPWYREMGGSVNALTTDTIGCYVWAATSNPTKELQVVSLPGNSLSEVSSYNTATGNGRGILYDQDRDRVYMLTNKSLLIFKPSSSPNPCT